MRSSNFVLMLILLVLAGCGSVKDDLFPSGSDKRAVVETGTTGPAVGQNAPDFTVSDTLGNSVTLSAVVPAYKGIVLYFTMWCPTCDSHMSYLRDSVIPQNPTIAFYAVDYVSGSVTEARNAQVSNGYVDSGFIVLADTAHTILDSYNGTMGTTVVIDKNGIIQMNEDLKNGSKLQTVLGELP